MLLLAFALLFPLQVARAEPNNPKRSAIPSFIYSGDAPYGVPTANLSSILTCPNGYPTPSSKPVLLVHGTGSTGYETWGQTYVPALEANGYTPCYVTLPNRSAGDVQVTSAYVAYNIHLLSHIASGPTSTTRVAVIGHSQGNPNIQWALRFFPSTRTVVSSFFGLSPDLGPGTEVFRLLCDLVGGLPACDPATWQQATNSSFLAALDYQGHQAFVPTTTVYTETDDIVIPAEENAELPGATTISVQSICALQIPDHFLILANSVAFALALDALSHGGIADPLRISNDVCGELEAPGMNATAASLAGTIVNDLILGNALAGPKVFQEPPVLPYAQIQNQ